MSGEDEFVDGVPDFLRRENRGERLFSRVVGRKAAVGERPGDTAPLPSETPPPTPALEVEAPERAPAIATMVPTGPRKTIKKGDAGDAPFQVTLPKDLIRQVRLRAAEEDTTHRAIILRALKQYGFDIPDGEDVDRRKATGRRD